MGLHTCIPGNKVTKRASGAVSKYRFVQFSGAQCNAKGQLALGVSWEEDTVDGYLMSVVIDGTTLVTAGEALDEGDKVTTNGLGKAVVAAAGNYINGVVMRAQAVADQLVEIRLGGNMISTVPSTTTTTTTTTSSTSTTTTTAP